MGGPDSTLLPLMEVILLPEVISVSLTCMLRCYFRGWKGQRLCSEHDPSSVNEDEDKDMRRRFRRDTMGKCDTLGK